jgi:hypothetical protein
MNLTQNDVFLGPRDPSMAMDSASIGPNPATGMDHAQVQYIISWTNYMFPKFCVNATSQG